MGTVNDMLLLIPKVLNSESNSQQEDFRMKNE